MTDLGSAVPTLPPTGAGPAAPAMAGESPAPPLWTALAAELDHWAAAGRTATFWWRDDDAVDATPALDRLLGLADDAGIPLALAVIPAGATGALAQRLAHARRVTVLQHGWAHRNHAPPGAKKAELGDDRPAATVLAELERGRDRLSCLFAGRGKVHPGLLVPPWNRAGPAVTDALAARGIALSRFGGRPAGNRRRLDTHVDPVAWKAPATGPHRPFASDDAALHQAIRHLEARRTGDADAVEATGILTHHLVHDDPTWDFLARFAAAVSRHPAATWLGVAEALAGGDGGG